MSSAAKLKKQALQHEHDRQYEKALAIYARLLDEPSGAGDEEIDVALFNRAGDLALRAGDVARAVTYYERAVDLYAAGGLLNNAIALCNKILRHAPDRISAHYSLGVLHAKQGFRGDARVHFIEYAERMHRAGNDEEALRALRELAELCAPGDDVRALLASHLARTGRGGASASSLQSILDGAGVARPAAPPRLGDVAAAAEPPAERAGDALVFLDLTGAPVADEDVAMPAAIDAARPEIGSTEVHGSVETLPLLDAAAGDRLDLLDASEPAWSVGASWAPDAAPRHAATLPGELPLLDLATPATSAAPRADVAPAPARFEDDGGPLELVELDAAALAGATFDAPTFDTSTFEAPAFDTATPAVSAIEDVPFDAPLPMLDLEEPAGGEAAEAWTVEPEPVAIAPVDLALPAPDALVDLPADAPANAPTAAAPVLAALPALDDARHDAPAIVAPAIVAPGIVAPAPAPAETYVDLGDWARELDVPRSTRMVTADVPQSGDEQADFERMLEAFKAGVDRNIDDADFDSHYDLGVAFREMGLFEEAATQFQRAARAPGGSLRAIEALGECFVELGRPELALETLGRVASDEIGEKSSARDEQLVGVLYLLGVASERTGRADAAAGFYRRVLAIDLQFRDAARRLAQLPPPPPR